MTVRALTPSPSPRGRGWSSSAGPGEGARRPGRSIALVAVICRPQQAVRLKSGQLPYTDQTNSVSGCFGLLNASLGSPGNRTSPKSVAHHCKTGSAPDRQFIGDYPVKRDVVAGKASEGFKEVSCNWRTESSESSTMSLAFTSALSAHRSVALGLREMLSQRIIWNRSLITWRASSSTAP